MANFIFILLTLLTHTQIETISFGNGGGFTGISDDFKLNREGDLFKVNVFTEETELLRKIDKEEVKRIFKYVEGAHLRNIDLNEPGNLYRYIDIKDKKGNHRIVWSGKSENNTLNLIYQQLNALRKLKE